MTLGFPTRSNLNRAAQPQNMVEGVKFQIYEVAGLYYEAKLFWHSKRRFSYDVLYEILRVSEKLLFI